MRISCFIIVAFFLFLRNKPSQGYYLSKEGKQPDPQ